MRGHIARKAGRWYPVTSHQVDGERKVKWHPGHRPKREAEEALSEIVDRSHKRSFVVPTRQTVAEYMREWHAGREGDIAHSFFVSSGGYIERRIVPAIGDVRLHDLSPAHLRMFYADLGKHAPGAVRQCHAIIRKAIQDAVEEGTLLRNPADVARPKDRARNRTNEPKMRTWTADQVKAFLAQVRDDRLFAAWVVAATTGMRRAELLGARWQDADLDAGRLAIRQTLLAVRDRIMIQPTTKTGKARRIDLDPQTTAILREWKKRQMEERLAFGSGYRESGLIFTRPDGSPVHPDRLSRAFQRHVKAAGLPRVRFHDLRHTWASVALESGEHMKVVQERLGHASIQTTMNIYAHVAEGLPAEAASRMAAKFLG